MNRRTTKKGLVSPQWALRQHHLTNPDLKSGVVFETRQWEADRIARRQAQEEADAQAKRIQQEEAEAKKKRFEEAEKARKEREEAEVKAKQEIESASNIANEPSASVQKTSKDTLDNIHKYFQESLDTVRKENEEAAKQFADSIKSLLPGQVNIESPDNINNVIDPYGAQEYNSTQKNTVESAVDREIRRQYGAEIDAYNQRLSEAEKYDAETNAQIDERNANRVRTNYVSPSGENMNMGYEPHVDTAAQVRNQWENSDVYQRIQATRNYMLQNYTPNEALANKVLDFGSSDYNPAYVKASDYQNKLDTYKTAKAQYDEAVKALDNRREYFKGTRGINSQAFAKSISDEFGRLNAAVQQASEQLAIAEKDLDSSFTSKDKYEHDLQALSNSIRVNGLPKDKQKLTKYSQHVINSLGLMDVLYNPDGSLNEEFTGVGYASDEDIDNAAKAATNYFSSADFKSDTDAADEYLNHISDDIKLKKDMYQHLSQADADASADERRQYSAQYRNLEKAEEILDKAKRHKYLNDIVKRADGFWTKQTATNIGYGVQEKLKDKGFWTLGLSELGDAIDKSKLADKINSGQELDQSEKSLASALAIEAVMHQNYGEYEKTMGYKAGQVATESMKFMAEMAATGGWSKALESSGRAAMKAAANRYVRKFGADGFKNILGRNLAKVPGLLRVIGGDAAYSMILANTLQAPSTVADVINLTTGDIVPEVQDGEITIGGYEGAKSLGRAIYEAEARAFTENMSEMIGEYGIGALLKYPFKYFGKQAIKNSRPLLGAYIAGSNAIDNAQKLINNMLPTKVISSFIKPVGSFIKAGHYSGIVGETAEEYYGNAMQHLLGVSEGTKIVVDENGQEKEVKTSFWEEIDPTTELGKQTFFDIVGGIALSTGFLGGGSALNYARIAHNYDKNKKRLIDLVGKDVVEKMETSLTQAHSSNIPATANTIIKGISNAAHREAFIDFYGSMMKFHGASQADQKIRESNDTDVFERAQRDAEINGYSVQYNTQRADLERAVDSIRSYAEQELGVEDGQLDRVIEDNGGAAEFISYLKSSGNDSMASIVMAYNNTRMQYEASMRRLMDDIDEDLANNERWVNRVSNERGKVVVGTTTSGQTVFVKSGTHIEDGQIKKDGKDLLVINMDGSVQTIDSKTVKDDFEEIDSNELKHDMDRQTYVSASEGLDFSKTSQKIGIQIQMSKGRIGTILNRTADGRIMYSVNDSSTNTEVVRITDPGVTEDQLIEEWANDYNTEFQNEQIKKAQSQLNQDYDKSAQIVATRELREYIRDVKERQRHDLESKHGKAIKYASGVLTKNTVDKVISDIDNARTPFIGEYVNIFNNAKVTVDASNWERLHRLIKAYKRGNISKKQLKEVLSDGSTNMSERAKEDLQNMTVDRYGNVTWWKDQNDTNLQTHVDISEYDLNEEDLTESENLISESIKEEQKRLNSRQERKKRGEVGRKAAKERRAEQKKLREQEKAEKGKQQQAKLPKKVAEQVSKHVEPAPVPTPSDITNFVVNKPEFQSQQNAVNKLQRQADWTSANVLRDQTTSHNYFIMIDGKRVMFTRTHGVLDDLYEHIAEDAVIEANRQKLLNVYNTSGIDALKSEILGMMKQGGVEDQSQQYVTYLDENPDAYLDVIDGVSNVSVPRITRPSVTFGQYIDTLCRLFFNGETITLDTQLEDDSYVKDHMDQKTLDKFIDQCKQLKSIYDALGWQLMSNRTVFTYNAFDKSLGKNVNVAGETDMIAVDRQGNYHIIDFKTSYKAFDSFINGNGDIINLFESIPAPYKGNKAKRSTKEQYTNQLTMYSMMIESTLNGTVDSIEIMPFRLDYDANRLWFWDIENYSRVLNNAKTDKYKITIPQRIILTKSGELIDRFTQDSAEKEAQQKKDIEGRLKELLAQINELSTDDLTSAQVQYVESTCDQMRNNINKMLSGMPNLSSSEYGQIDQQIRSIQLKYEDISSYISAQALDNKLNRLEEAKMQEAAQQNMQSHDAWLQQQASAETKWAADWKATFEQDYQTLVYLCKYMANWAKEHNNSYVVQPELMQQFNQLVSNLQYMIDFDNEVLGTTSGKILNLDYNTISKVERCINWVHTHITDVVPVQPIVPPESPKEYQNAEKPWQSTNGLYKDKFRDSNGVSSATAIDDDTLLLSAVTKNADFVDNSEFRVLTSNGKLYIQITYGGHTYTPVAFFSARTENGRKLNNRMFQALRSANSNQKVILTGGVKRSFGEFIVKEGGQYKTAHEQGMIALTNDEPGVNIYDIEYSSTSSTIGITYTREIQSGSNKITVTEVRVPSSEDAAKQKFERQMQNAGWVTDKNTGAKRRMVPDSPYALAFGSAIYTYSNVNQNKPRSGVFVFMHNLGYTDDPTCCVPVTMRHSFISKNDASFIIDALLGKYNGLIKKRTGVVSANNPLGFSTTSTEFVKGFGGNVVIGGQTIDVKISDIVDLIIPVKGCPSYESQLRRQDPTQRMPIYMNLDNVNETGEVLIVGNVEGDGIDTMQRSFNIRTNSGIQALEDFLQRVERNMNMNGFAQTRLGKIGSISDQYGYPMPLSNSPAGGVSLKDYVKKHGSLQFGNSCIRFDAADFSNPAVQGDSNGITGIAWYLKNGFLECMYNGTTDPLIRIEDDAQVSVVDEDPIETQQPVTTKKEEAAVTKAIESAVPEVKETDIASILQQELKKRNSSAADALNSMTDGFYKQQQETAKNPISKEKAMANLIRILGEDVPVKFIPQLVAISKAGAEYVGICEADVIKLSYQAEEGTEYHEAFHRVMEVLFTPEQRKKAYDKFRSAKPGRQQLTDGQIAEIFADEFMYYAMNQPVVKLHWNVIKMWREIIDWCKMWRSLGSWNIFRLYAKINSGKYANLKPDLRSLETFKQRAGGKGFFYTANRHEFKHIVNSIHYKKLLNFIAMSFMHNSVQKINIDGSNLDQFKLDLDLLLKKQRNLDSFVEGDTSIEQPANFFTIAMANAPESTYRALKEMIDNFDAIKSDLAAYISLFASDYKVRYEEQNNSKKEGVDTVGGQFDDIESTTSEEDITGSWIDDHIKESYEFAPITRTTQKTKFFFSGIPKRELTDDGWRLKLNELELPEMYDMQYAYITVLNEVSDCRSIPDLYNKLLEIGENDDLFNFVANKFGKLWNKVLSGNANANEKALVTQIFTQIKSTTSEFMLAKSTNKNGEYDVQLEKTDQSYRAKQYVDDWAQSFAVGGCKFFKQAEDGLYKMNSSFKPDVFQKLSALITSIVDSANKDDLSIIEANRIKQQLCICLNMLGVTFTTDMLNIYLRRTYNDTNKDGLVQFFNDNKNYINGFCKKLNALVYKDALNITDDGRVDAGNKPPLDKYFANDNFLSRLADAKYMWHRAHDQMSVLIANNAKAYTKSENNLITDRLDEIMYDEEVQHQLMSDAYNYNSENNTGSIFLKNRGTKLRFVTMGGFKTDEYGNTGIDYVQQSKREDWIGKAVALTDGYILSPTMSDKKTWGFIDGLRQKMQEFAYDGTDFSNSFINGFTNDESGNIIDLYIPDTVLNQMLEYAYCENASIKHVLDQIGTDKQGNKIWLIPEDKLVENFHNGKVYWIKDRKVYEKKEDAPEGAIEVHPVQGARYTSLLGVYENGTPVEFNQLIDEDGNYKDEWANYNTAQEKFFSKSLEEQKRMLREILLNRVREELKQVEDLGLIQRQAVGENTRDSLLTYKNTGLPVGRIRQLEDKIKSAYDSTQLSVDQLNTIHSLAIVAYITDITNRHIISMQEFERMFSGNPAFFKFGYDSNGHLIDRTVDQSKRLGGLASTGTNNCLDIPGTPTEYTCVEVDNPMMVAAHIEQVQKDVYDGEIRSAYLRHLLEENDASLDNNTDIAEEIASNVDAMSIEEIEEAMKDMPLLDIAKKIAESKIKKLKKVDIADGAAYVTDEMCENLLKMVGSWNKEIEEAFQILRGIKKNPKTGKPYSVADTRATGAYAKIYTSVIGAQKYTAYGYRFQDGLAVPYYNKMALFPMFKNMCTGNMAKLYNAVKAQGVDMIMINSAVKVGSQAKYDLKDWDNIDFTNHKYKQKYAYLRKQFNTDPKEKELMSVGTQMTKIVMSSMIAGRSYNVNGQMVTATQIRNDIMTAINKLSDYGKQQILDKFFKDGQFDIELFSNTLKDELSSRGATKESIAACDVEDGEMLLSLDAMSSSNWIQSILVSMINKQVVDINMPGSAFYQRSSWGMEGETSIIGDDNLPPSINNGNKLEVLNEDGSMDCVLSIDFFANILKGTKVEHADFESQRAYLIRKGIIGPTAKANMIAYRIPTQAISSIHALRCVDVIPTVRDTVILPAEITAITGSDKISLFEL